MAPMYVISDDIVPAVLSYTTAVETICRAESTLCRNILAERLST